MSLLLLAPIGVVAPGALAGAGGVPRSSASPGSTVCGGTVAVPEALPCGTYTSLDVTGVCDISAGPVGVTGNVTVESSGALVSAWKLPQGATTVDPLGICGDLRTMPGSALILGCEPTFFPCRDAPAGSTARPPGLVAA
jgi:hypothetical protein